MKIRNNVIKSLLAAMLILVLTISASIGILPATPAFAAGGDVNSVVINSPLTTVYSHNGGSVAVNYTVTMNGAGTVDNLRIILNLMKGGSVVGTPTIVPYPGIDPTGGPYTWTDSLSIVLPSGTPDNTYDLRVDGQFPQGSGTIVQSTIIVGCISIHTTSSLLPPTGLLPINGSCIGSTSQNFSWVAAAGTNLTYNFQLANNTSFSSPIGGNTGTNLFYSASSLTTQPYYWHVQTQDQYGNLSAWTSTRTICVDLTTPVGAVTNTSPVSGSTVGGNYNPTLTWTGGADACTCANIQYTVQIAADSSFLNILDSTTVSGLSYARSSPLGAGTFYWRVRATNCAGTTSASYSTAWNFIIPATTTTYSIPLSSGWNLISLPLIPTDNLSNVNTTLTRIISGISAYVVLVDYYNYGTNCSAPLWQSHYPSGSLYTLTTMEAGKAYWINVNHDCTLSGYGRPVPPPPSGPPYYSLCYFAGNTTNAAQGWNMMGFKSNQTGLKIADYVGTTSAGKYDQIYRYAGGWVPITAGSDFLIPGVGYFINVNTSFSYGAPTN